jgi:hypothetical protein
MLFPFSSDRVLRDHLSAEQLIRVCDVIWSTDRRARVETARAPIPPGAIVYAKADHFIPLFHQLRRARNRVILVTSETDFTITREVARCRPLQVAEWFSANALDASVQPIPLGLGNSYYEVTLKAPLIAECAKGSGERSRWLYVNFRPETNPAMRLPIMHYFESLSKAEWLTVRRGDADLEGFVRELTSHRFVLCPPGNGIDTHRMWEALYGRTIPIVLRNSALRAFADLPILFVDDFRVVTRPFLEEQYLRMAEAQWNWEKLFVGWWSEQFYEAKRRLRKRGARVGVGEFCGRVLSTGWKILARREF